MCLMVFQNIDRFKGRYQKEYCDESHLQTIFHIDGNIEIRDLRHVNIILMRC